MANKLSDRVEYWMTINGPQVFIGAGYVDGTHAPGEKLDWGGVLRIAHQVLLAHGKGVQAVRAAAEHLLRQRPQPLEIYLVYRSDLLQAISF